ncbi:phytoene desaturase family protein [Nocardioides coralli]|uniref:phytoene desaturase family protein n=1 Tax=Nocardioides coralli TaxID=2872154 RepID=UPI0024B5DE16|nr:NAD(P)/FAD-dependent oxidoreductase [Nocardioides coralli]
MTVVGGGHNGLTAAAYLARAGMSVLVLERLGHVGGAAVSASRFTGQPARFPRYASLVSVLPQQVIDDLGLDVTLASRPTSSYAPVLREGDPAGLLVERPEGEATNASFRELTGGDDEYEAWCAFHRDVGELAAVVAPSLLEPLPVERDVRGQVSEEVWRDLVTSPLGEALRRRFTDDTVRGVVASDAVIGTFASLHDASLAQNRCFLYHRIGNGTGEWRVPVGGMGALTVALERAARDAGAEIITGAGVSCITAEADAAEVHWHDGATQRSVLTRHVLANVAPWVLRILMGEGEDAETKPQGSQLSINLLVDRLPRLRSGADPEVAFGGTLHVGTGLGQLEAAYAEAAAGRVPSVVPGTVICPSLTDPSVLGGAPEGTHTLTYVGMHLPAALFDADRDATRKLAVERALAAIDEHLEEPLATCLARDAEGNPCIESGLPQDVEADLAMPGGHIFHGDLDWPWASNRARLETPAQQWGVQTDVESVMVCGSGARRGGGVSGLGGHNAAQAVLASR